MRLARRTKILLDPQMDGNVTATEPRAAARTKVFRLFDLVHAENARVEPARFSLPARRHRKLHVIDSVKHGS